jgi:hypothetical protein
MSLRPEVVKDTYYYLADISKNKSKLNYRDNSNNLTNCIDYVAIIRLFSIFVPN